MHCVVDSGVISDVSDQTSFDRVLDIEFGKNQVQQVSETELGQNFKQDLDNLWIFSEVIRFDIVFDVQADFIGFFAHVAVQLVEEAGSVLDQFADGAHLHEIQAILTEDRFNLLENAMVVRLRVAFDQLGCVDKRLIHFARAVEVTLDYFKAVLPRPQCDEAFVGAP